MLQLSRLPCLQCLFEFCILTFPRTYRFSKKQRSLLWCLRYGHRRTFCRHKATCKHCGGQHLSILHVNGPIHTINNVANTSSISILHNTNVSSESVDLPVSFNDESECTIANILVKIRVCDSITAITTFAFIDPGSNTSFCAENLMYQLGVEGKRIKLTMDTINSTHTIHTFQIKGLEILGLDEHNVVQLPVIYTKDKMSVSKRHIPTSNDLTKWTHLNDIVLPKVDADVGLLIGNNVIDACAPYMSRSILKWIPCGTS